MAPRLFALLITAVLFCAGFLLPVAVSAALQPGEPRPGVVVAGENQEPLCISGESGDSAAGPSAADAEQAFSDHAGDGAEFLMAAPSLSAALGFLSVPPFPGRASLPQPFIEGPKRPPRAVGHPA